MAAMSLKLLYTKKNASHLFFSLAVVLWSLSSVDKQHLENVINITNISSVRAAFTLIDSHIKI